MRKGLQVLANLLVVFIYFAGFAAAIYYLIILWVEMRYDLASRVILSALDLLLVFSFLAGVFCIFDETVENEE